MTFRRDNGTLDLPGIRRALHRIPELAFEETRTSAFVHDVISGLVAASGRAGVEVRRHRTFAQSQAPTR